MSNQPERLLILAEGFSADPHYGKTARGVLAYGERPVVALLDSTRAGETQNGVPVVASVNDALCFNPTTALVGVATQGGRFPPAWRELLKTAISKDLHVENGLHEFLADDEELAGLAARHGVGTARPSPAAGGPERPDRREPRAAGRRPCSPSAPTARSGR